MRVWGLKQTRLVKGAGSGFEGWVAGGGDKETHPEPDPLPFLEKIVKATFWAKSVVKK